ncbi:uncharacterized protein LOC142319892 [Lycorma delicatula]|uniref:uncharacterized protein LOC142319892 n=1 Tax=Lycorma delicatula TaxID=130591 RepID=UPI003F512B35
MAEEEEVEDDDADTKVQGTDTMMTLSYMEEEEVEEDDADTKVLGTDTMMTEAKKLYSNKTKKLLPPVPTSRRVLGYCRPANYYTELSEYQGTYSYLGYNILKQYEKKGKSRLAPRYNCKPINRFLI